MAFPTKMAAQRTDETLKWCNSCKQKTAFGHSECKVKEKCGFKTTEGESTSQYKITGCLQKNCVVSKVNKKLISHLTRAKRTPSAAATVQVSHALPAVRFSCLMRRSGASFQDGVAAGKSFLCAPF